MSELADRPASEVIQWLMSREAVMFRDRNGRRTFRFEEHGSGYFAKVHSGVAVGEILKEWTSLRAPVLDARREARALDILQRAGVPAPALVASGSSGLWPTARRSFVITEDVGTQRTLNDVAASLEPQDFMARRDLIRRVASLARRMHAAGVNHRDLYLGHVLVRGGAEPWSAGDPGELVLIDLHRAQVWQRIPERWVTKDLGCLAFEGLRLGLTRTDRARFVAAYGARDQELRPGRAREVLRLEPTRWRAVGERAARLRREEERKGQGFGG